MEMKNYIEIGEKKAGKQIELAKILGIRDSYIRNAKAGKQGLPDAVCIVLAEYIGEDPLEVIAASNLVTEKDEGRRKIFERFLKKPNSAAASVTIALLITLILTLSPVKPAQAVEQISEKCILCKIAFRKLYEKIAFLLGKLLSVIPVNKYAG